MILKLVVPADFEFSRYAILGNSVAICTKVVSMKPSLRYLVFIFSIAATVQISLKTSAKETQSRETSKAKTNSIMWRYDGNGNFPAIIPPSQWSSNKTILWKSTVDAGGYSSPIVVKDKVFVTAEMGSLICLDLTNGKTLWKKDLFSKESKDIPEDLSKRLMRGCGGDSKQSTPTPASNGEFVFYINAMGLCACYDLDGNQKWIQIIETAKEEEHFSSSPIFIKDQIILSWGCLLSLNAKDGSTLWKAAKAKPTHGTPTITKIGGDEIIVTPGGDIVKLADGEIICSGLFESLYTTPLIHNNILYMIDSESKAFELPTKLTKNMKLKELWKTNLTGTVMASPSYKDGLIYTTENQRCILYVIDSKTGKILTSSKTLDETTKKEKTDPGIKIDGLIPAKYVYASPVLSEKYAYFFDDAGTTAVLELGPNYKPVGINKIDDALVGTPFFINDKIIIRGSETIYCIGGKNQ